MNMDDHINDVLEKLFQKKFNNREEIEWDLLSLLKRDYLSPKALALLVIRVFTGDKNIFKYIEANYDSKDTVSGKSKIMLLEFLKTFLQMYPEEVLPHLRHIFDQTFRIFRRDPTSAVKVTSAVVVKKILKAGKSNRKMYSQKVLDETVQSSRIGQLVLEELDKMRLSATVKREAYQILGLLIKRNPEKLQGVSKEVQTMLFREVFKEIDNNKNPKIPVIVGCLKGITHLMHAITPEEENLVNLVRVLEVTCIKIDDVKTNTVITASLKLLAEHSAQVLPFMKNKEINFSDIFLEHMKASNKKLKNKASASLERLCDALATLVVEENQGEYYKELFVYLNSKLKTRIKNSEEPVQLMTCIRCMGFLSKGLKLWQGPAFLHAHFGFLVENSQTNLMDKFDKLDNFSFEKNTQNFKTVLFNQKQLNSYLKCFALVSEQLTRLDPPQVKYVLRLVEMGFKYYLNYFPLYRAGLHEALVRCLSALKMDQVLTLEFTAQVEKIFANMFASSRGPKFHNLIFFADLFSKVFDAPELGRARQEFCLKPIFDRVTQFLNASEFQHPRLLCLFMQELFHRRRFSQLLPANEELFNSLAYSLEKKILKDPLQTQNLSLFSLLLKLRANYFDAQGVSYEDESLWKICGILAENLFRLSSRDRLSALECFLDLPLGFYAAAPRFYGLCLGLGLFMLRRPKKSLYLIHRLIQKLHRFTLELPEQVFLAHRPAFFEALMGCLSFQLSLSFEDRILLDAHFDSSLAGPDPRAAPRVSKKFAKISKIGRLQEKEPLLARSNLFVFNLADFNIKFEGLFHQILLIFKHFENRSASLDTRIVLKKPESPFNCSLPKGFSSLVFNFSDLNLSVSTNALFGLLLSSQASLETGQKKPLFAKNEAFYYLAMKVLHSIGKMKNKEVSQYIKELKSVLKPIIVQALTEENKKQDLDKAFPALKTIVFKFSLVPASKKCTHPLVSVFLESILEISRDSTRLSLTQSVSQCTQVFLSMFVSPLLKIEKLTANCQFLIETLKLFASSSFDVPTSQIPFYVVVKTLYSTIFEVLANAKDETQRFRPPAAKVRKLEELVSLIHFSFVEVICHDPKLFSVSPPRDSFRLFADTQTLIREHAHFFDSNHLLSILKSLNHLSDSSLVFKKLSSFGPFFPPATFNEHLLAALPLIQSHDPDSTFARLTSVLSDGRSTTTPDFWASPLPHRHPDFYPRLFGLFMFENSEIVREVLSPNRPHFAEILQELFTSELLSTVPLATFCSLSKFLLARPKETFAQLRQKFLGRMDLYNLSFGKLRLLMGNLYSFLKQATPELLRGLFDGPTVFTLFYTIDDFYSHTKMNKGLLSKFSLVLRFLCKLGVLHLDFFYRNLTNPRFPSYTKCFAKYVSKGLRPEKKTFPLIIYADNRVQPDCSLQGFVSLFADRVKTKNLDLPALTTFLQTGLDSKLGFPGFSRLLLEGFLGLFQNEPLETLHGFLEKLFMLDPHAKNEGNRGLIRTFLEGFDFEHERDFKTMTEFFLKAKERFGVDPSGFRSTLDRSFQQMVDELPFDLVSLRRSSPEALRVNRVIDKIIRISFETGELSLLKHLFHVFSDRHNEFLRVFETTLTGVCSDSQIPEADLEDYARDLLDCVYLHAGGIFPDQFYHRLNIFTYILVPVCNLLAGDSLVRLLAANFEDWLDCLHREPPSLLIACEASLRAANDHFLRQHMVLKLLALTFKKLEKGEILGKLYPLLQSEKYPCASVTKLLIKRATLLEVSLDTVHQVLVQLREQSFGFKLEMVELILYTHSVHFRASLFGCLSSLLMKTQSNLRIIADFLIFKGRGKNTPRVLKFLPPSLGLHFGVHTYFEIQSLNDLGASLMKSFKSSVMSQKFSAFQPKTPKSVDSEARPGSVRRPIDKENSIELDDVNKLPISLELIDLFSSVCFQFQLEKEIAISALGQVFAASGLKLHHKIVLLKVLVNNPANFENHKGVFLPHILEFICSKDTGGAGMHYFLRDLITLFCDWVCLDPTVLDPLPDLESKVSLAAKNIIKKLADKSRVVAIHNFDLFLKFVDCVANHLSLDLQFFLKMLAIQVPVEKDADSKNRREELRLWKFTGLCVIETLVFKHIRVSFREKGITLQNPINSKKMPSMTRALVETLLEVIRGSPSRYLAFKAASVLGMFLRRNPWVWAKAELCNPLTASLFSIRTRSKGFLFSMLNHLSFYYPRILFQTPEIRNLIQTSARKLSAQDVEVFLSCLFNLFEFGDDLSREFALHSNMLRIVFFDLVFFLEKTRNSGAKFNKSEFILVLLKKFLGVSFAERLVCARHLVDRLAQMDIAEFPKEKRVFVHSLVLEVALLLKSQDESVPEEDAPPSFATINSGLMASVNESFQRIEKLHFQKEDSPEKDGRKQSISGSENFRILLLKCISDEFLKHSVALCVLVRDMFQIGSFSDVLEHLFLPSHLQLSVRAICVFLFCCFSQQTSFSLSPSEAFHLKTEYLETLLFVRPGLDLENLPKFLTPKKRPPAEPRDSDFKKINFSGFSPFPEVRPGYQAKSFLANLAKSGSFSNSSFNDGGPNVSENQSLFSFHSKLKGFGLNEPATELSDYSSKNTLVRFNQTNSNQMPLRFKKRYFSDQQLKRQTSFVSSGSLPDELFSLSGIFPQNCKQTSPLKMQGMHWSTLPPPTRRCMRQALRLPEELRARLSSPVLQWVLSSIQPNQKSEEHLPELESDAVNNERLGYVLMLLSMDNQTGSPAIFGLLLTQAFKNSNAPGRKAIFETLLGALRRKPEAQLDSAHRKLFSDVLFAIFLEDRELLMTPEVPELLFDNGINHLAFLLMGELLSRGRGPGISPPKRRARRVRRETPKRLEMNVSRDALEKAGVKVGHYFRLCELLGLKQEKWGLYDSLFESQREAVKLLKQKENKYYQPFVRFIEQNPHVFSTAPQDKPKSEGQLNLLKFFCQANNLEGENKDDAKLQIEGPRESKKNDIQELIEKEIEDSLFHLGEWAKFTETIEQKYPWKPPCVGFLNNKNGHLNMKATLNLSIENQLPFSPDARYLSHLYQQDQVSASRYFKAHIYDPALWTRLSLKWASKQASAFSPGRPRDEGLALLEYVFSGELAFHSLRAREFDKVKYFNQVNKELLKKGLLHFEKKGRARQLKLIENTNLFLELEDFLAFKTKLVRLEDPHDEIRAFLDTHERWVSASRFRHFESCVNTFLFRENMFALLDSDVQTTALGPHLERLKLKNFCAHADNLRDLGFVDFGLAQVDKAHRLLRDSELGSAEWLHFLETTVGLKVREFEKKKGEFTLESLRVLQSLVREVRDSLGLEAHRVKADILALEVNCLFVGEYPHLAPQVQVPLPRILALHSQVSEEYQGRLLQICQKTLRLDLDAGRPIDRQLIRVYFELIRAQMLRCEGASNAATGPSRQIPFIFRLIKQDPQAGAEFFPRAFSEGVPSWFFLGWEQQLVSFLKPKFQFLSRDVLGRLIADFPHLVVYNLYFNRGLPEVQALIDQFAAHLGSYFTFIEGLLELNDPELEFNEEAIRLKKALDKTLAAFPALGPAGLPDLRGNEELADLFTQVDSFVAFLETLLRKCREKETKIFSMFKRLMERELRDLQNVAAEGTFEGLGKKLLSTIKKMNASLKGKMENNQFSVFDYSPKLSVYCQYFYDKILSLETGRDCHMLCFPFQRDPAKTMRIKRILPDMKVMDSYKKPKRITVILQNNEARHILVKFGEDLRTDSRIQKVFGLVNACLDPDHFGDAGLGVFGVHPLTPASGFLEWIRGSRPLSQLVSEGMDRGQYNDNRAITKCKELLSQMKAGNDNHAHLELFNADDETVCQYYDEEARIVGRDSLKKSFLKRCRSAREFFEVRRRFTQDYALVCVIGYILGIGDRHCDNLMLTREGRVYLIDFACCFGQGLHLAVPETVPFRLTPNILEMMKPFGAMGSFRSQMVKALRDIRAHRWTLTDYISIYAEEPSSDWSNLSLSKKLGLPKFISTRISLAKKKLELRCPISLLSEDLRISVHAETSYVQNLERILGCLNRPKRDVLQDPEELVDVLLQMSTFKPLLGRMWIGWTSFV